MLISNKRNGCPPPAPASGGHYHLPAALIKFTGFVFKTLSPFGEDRGWNLFLFLLHITHIPLGEITNGVPGSQQTDDHNSNKGNNYIQRLDEHRVGINNK